MRALPIVIKEWPTLQEIYDNTGLLGDAAKEEQNECIKDGIYLALTKEAADDFDGFVVTYLIPLLTEHLFQTGMVLQRTSK